MTDWPLIFVAGLLGSSHCIGMCGPFAVVIGSGAPSQRKNLQRQLLYSLGRVFTYAFLGAVAGFSGLWLTQRNWQLVSVQGILAVVAGVALILLGLAAAGLLPRWRRIGSGPCLAAGWIATFLRSPGWTNIFLAGIFTGFIPCGLVYAFLALAVTRENMAAGALTMALFGLGTLPAMILTGWGGNWLSATARGRVLRVAAWCVILAGAMSIWRGAVVLKNPGPISEASCPLCAEGTATSIAPE